LENHKILLLEKEKRERKEQLAAECSENEFGRVGSTHQGGMSWSAGARLGPAEPAL